jgi:hypothetical protein
MRAHHRSYKTNGRCSSVFSNWSEKVSRMKKNIFKLDRKKSKTQFQSIDNYGLGWLLTVKHKSSYEIFPGLLMHLDLDTLPDFVGDLTLVICIKWILCVKLRWNRSCWTNLRRTHDILKESDSHFWFFRSTFRDSWSVITSRLSSRARKNFVRHDTQFLISIPELLFLCSYQSHAAHLITFPGLKSGIGKNGPSRIRSNSWTMLIESSQLRDIIDFLRFHRKNRCLFTKFSLLRKIVEFLYCLLKQLASKVIKDWIPEIHSTNN